MNLIDKKAPNFTAQALLASGEIVPDFNLYERIKNKKCYLLFYPLDFTFICPSEILAINKSIPEFKKLNTEVIAVSIDSVFTHKAWKETEPADGGIGNIQFTLISDMKHNIIKDYCTVDENMGAALRSNFLIDEEGFIKSVSFTSSSIGRNVSEILRLLEAMEFCKQNKGHGCPANWSRDKSSMKLSPEGVKDYLKNNT